MNCASVVRIFRSFGVGWWGFPQKYRDFGKRSKIPKRSSSSPHWRFGMSQYRML